MSFHQPAWSPMSLSVLAPQIADILDDSLRAVFDRLCTQRYGAPISLQRVADPESSSSTVRFQIKRAGVPALEAEVSVRHLGGNMYDVRGTIEDGPTQGFSYCLPESGPLPLSKAPRLAQEVAAFFLDVLERRLGSELLRAELGRRSAPSAPSVA